jgi:hypothetical protein
MAYELEHEAILAGIIITEDSDSFKAMNDRHGRRQLGL